MSSTEIAPRPRPGLSQTVAHPGAQQVPAPATNSYPALRAMPAALPLTETAHIAKAIAAVQANIGTVPKGGFNAFHKYHYVRMEDMLQILTPLMGKNGLAIIPNEVDVRMVEGNRVAVTYEFSILHDSGERWPERPRFTGMAMARDSRGNFDDKAVNKCSTAARKYFLSSLFNVPTGDVEDADAGPPANQQEQRHPAQQDRRVPGPGTASAQSTQQAAASAKPAAPKGGPQKIVLGRDAGVQEWKQAYLTAVLTSRTRDEVLAWDALNDMALQRIHTEYPELSAEMMAVVERHIDVIEAPKASPEAPVGSVDTGFGIPDPRSEPGAAIAWVIAKLNGFKSYEAAENFWNLVVSAREPQFMPDDWENLMQEWRRTEARLGPEGESI